MSTNHILSFYENHFESVERIARISSAAEWEAARSYDVVFAATLLCAFGGLDAAAAMAPVEALARMCRGHREQAVEIALSRCREYIGTIRAPGPALMVAGQIMDMRVDESREQWFQWVHSDERTSPLYETLRSAAVAKMRRETAAWEALMDGAAIAAAPWESIGPALVATRWVERFDAWRTYRAALYATMCPKRAHRTAEEHAAMRRSAMLARESIDDAEAAFALAMGEVAVAGERLARVEVES